MDFAPELSAQFNTAPTGKLKVTFSLVPTCPPLPKCL